MVLYRWKVYMDYALTYTEVNGISILILIYILIRLKGDYGKSYEMRPLKKLSYSLILVALTDAMWALGESGILPYTIEANHLVNIIYLICVTISAYYWIVYNEIRLGEYEFFSRKIRFVAMLPLIIVSVCVVLSPFTKWVYYIDVNDGFHSGYYRVIQIIGIMIYLVGASAHALNRAIKARNHTRRNEYIALASFFILPLVLNVSVFFTPVLPVGAISMTLPLLMAYIKVQDTRIFSDALTGLNNRRRADEYFEMKIVDYHPNMVFFLGDINDFKNINDTYGHAEGDKALILASEVMKTVCGEYDAFLARYGGDEFCIIWEMTDKKPPERLIDAIQRNLTQATIGADLPYELTMSFGYARADGQLTGSQILDIADDMMYRNKEQAHKEKK